MSNRLILVALLTLSACTVTRDNYPDKYAAVYCDRLDECAPGDFENSYASFKDCKLDVADDTEDSLQVMEEWFPGCELLPDQARECLDQMKAVSCGDFVSGDFDGKCGTELIDC
ncbi:MAG: hypothetical protein JXX28_09085 [Deltaproteobacteria bacterium]|nr:hypothetical protein [Deltaproteobacteria bacterium]